MGKRNNVSSILLGVGTFEMILCFIVGFVVGQPEANMHEGYRYIYALPWWIGGFITGMLFLGLAEVIRLLDLIYKQLGNHHNQFKTNESNGGASIHEEETIDNITFYDGDTAKNGYIVLCSQMISFYEAKKRDELHLEIPLNRVHNCTFNGRFIEICFTKDAYQTSRIRFEVWIDPKDGGQELYELLMSYIGKS